MSIIGNEIIGTWHTRGESSQRQLEDGNEDHAWKLGGFLWGWWKVKDIRSVMVMMTLPSNDDNDDNDDDDDDDRITSAM